MKPTEISAGQLEIVSISSFDDMDPVLRDGATETWRRAFAQPPYDEALTSDDAEAALREITDQNGDLLVCQIGGRAVALAGGYPKADGTYYIGELAVAPEAQGKGYGRKTLKALIDAADNPVQFEIRTTVKNSKAIDLYESEGFAKETGTEVVAASRGEGGIKLDERVYLAKPPINEQERTSKLKRIAVAYPSGNTTAVVFDQLLNVNRKTLNTQVMQAWKKHNANQPEIEQCCFVTLPNNPQALARVEMFGGEFCGNATRSVAWMVTGGQPYDGFLEVSGVERPLAFSVREGEVKLEMPLPAAGDFIRIVPEGSLVQLDGIAQLVVQSPVASQSPRQLLAELIAQNRYDLARQPAVGVSYYDRESKKADFSVWVRDVDTVFDETACGSGTCAIGLALADQNKRTVATDVIQPSGEYIRTEAVYSDGLATKCSITGTVDVLYDGELRLT